MDEVEHSQHVSQNGGRGGNVHSRFYERYFSGSRDENTPSHTYGTDGAQVLSPVVLCQLLRHGVSTVHHGRQHDDSDVHVEYVDTLDRRYHKD